MKIVVTGGEEGMFPGSNAAIIYAGNMQAASAYSDADAIFDLGENSGKNDYSRFNCPVFISSTAETLSELKASPNMIRVNAWPGFLENEILEVAGDMNAKAAEVLKSLGKKYISVPDEPGFVSARVIAMIINEAFFAKGEDVSSEEDIDTAMKLGTNYPYGPFEWCRKIGTGNVYGLLKKLSASDEKYFPAPAMEKEMKERQ